MDVLESIRVAQQPVRLGRNRLALSSRYLLEFLCFRSLSTECSEDFVIFWRLFASNSSRELLLGQSTPLPMRKPSQHPRREDRTWGEVVFRCRRVRESQN